MKRETRRRPAGRRPAPAARPVTIAPPPPAHPAWLAAVTLAATALLLSMTFPIFDTDLWQHLAVGRAIWTLHRVPGEQLWSWPTWGSPDVTSSYSWLFRVLLWPLWEAAGVRGLFLWRWATTLAAFALLWLAARRMGARGFATLFVFVLAGLTYRQRVQPRPETLAAVLLGLEMWILEARRHGGPDRSPWLIAVLWLWVNSHLSFTFGFALAGFHLLGDLWARRRGQPAPEPSRTRTLALVLLAAAAAGLANPYGWRALAQPFDFALHHRAEPIYRDLAELSPLSWGENLRNGLPLLVAGWPLLLLRRALRRGLDPVEVLSCVIFTPLAIGSRRFVGVYALIAAPFLARDLEEALAALPLPALARSPWARGAAAAVAILAAGTLEWSRPGARPGFGMDLSGYPIAACDFIEANGVRGRSFAPYHFGGYLLWRFWPDRTRLPFMDVHQSGTTEIRREYQAAMDAPQGFSELDRHWRFDWVLLARVSRPVDVLDADTTWALVFLDDAAALYVRRSGPLSGLARSAGYRRLAAGSARLAVLTRACADDAGLADSLRAELLRQARESHWNASAWNLLGWIATERHEEERARIAFTRAVEIDPRLVPDAQAMLARIALRQGRPRDALRAIAGERRVSGPQPALDVLEGRAWRALGLTERARAAWRRALRRDPGSEEARDSLDALDAARGR